MNNKPMIERYAAMQAEQDRACLELLQFHGIPIEQAPDNLIMDRFYDGSWAIRLQTDGDRMLIKIKQAQRAASDAVRLIPAATAFNPATLDYAAIMVICEQYAIITQGMAESSRYVDQLPAYEAVALKMMIMNAFIEWCATHHQAGRAILNWSANQ